MITYQEESFYDILQKDLKPLLDLHWEEIALDKDAIKLNPDFDLYISMEEQKMLSTITVREEGKLIGYQLAILSYNMHYKDSYEALVDIYYIHPDYRKGRVGIKLFKYCEEVYREKGVNKISTACKLHHDVGSVFLYLKYKETERVFTKLIG